MDPVSAAPVAGSAGIPAAPRTPASSPPSAGRSRTDVPPPAGSSPPHTPLAAPARTVPRLSSLRPLPILAEDLLLPDFCSGPAALSGRSMRDYLSGALTSRGRVRQHHGWLSRQGLVPKSHVDYHNRARGDPVPQHPCAYSDGRDPLLNPLLTCPKGSDGEQRGQAEPYCLSRRTIPLPPSTSTTSPSWR